MFYSDTSCIDVSMQSLVIVMRLFRKSRSHTSPVVMAAVTMPCLKILHSLINPNVTDKKTDKVF